MKPAEITFSLEKLPGESTLDHLLRIGDECRRPRAFDLPTPPAKEAATGELSEEQIAKQSAEAMARLRPVTVKRRRKG